MEIKQKQIEHTTDNRTVKAALLGLGTVGSGVYQLVRERQEDFPSLCGTQIEISKILVRNPSKKREGIPSELLTTDWEEILHDPEISIIIEVMGGIEPAKSYLLAAMKAGKQIITANKDLIAEYGHELLDTAEANHCDLKFEAAVAGCVPIIQILKHSMVSEDITEIMGIVNGTTNYILTRMTQNGMTYEEALQEATDLGYAEADPTADVDGLDAGRKIAIMASIAFHSRVTFSDVYIEGIRKISAKDIFYAKEFGSVIKLLGIARKDDRGIEVKVIPILIPEKHPLATVHDSFNAVFVHGTASDDTMYYGRGAGKLPTASAVTGDLCSVARHLMEHHSPLHVCSCYKDIPIKPIEDTSSRFFLRMQVADRPGVLANITSVFGTNNVSIAQVVQKSRSDGMAELVIITDEVKELYFSDAMHILENLSIVKTISSLIRVY